MKELTTCTVIRSLSEFSFCNKTYNHILGAELVTSAFLFFALE